MTDLANAPRIYFAHPLLRARDWQHRPEFDTVCQWWRDGGAGVCALVGIGGAGKTAIAERFLRALPQVMPESPEIPKDENLPTPQNLFVFSFYDAPNPDSFFTELAEWLINKPLDESITPLSYQRTLMLLQNAGTCLLVLDGLEKVQDDGVRGGVFGQLLDKRLSDLIKRIAYGYLPNVCAMITTRFPMAELDVEQPLHYLSIPIEEISLETGIQLLRKRGVKGPDIELQRIVEECGRHALSVDLMGGYIAILGGDTNLKLASSEELKRAIEKERDPRRRRVIEQEYRFARIAERYSEAFAQKDPAALALLQRVCLFRLGIDAPTLASIFIGEGKETISGSALARLTKKELLDKLNLLVEMRLLESIEQKGNDSTTKIQYLVHPAVRDGFIKTLDAETAQHGHEAAREGLTTSLGGLPYIGSYPYDPITLDLLEEIVYHTLAAGHTQEAWDIYWNRIGGGRNLLWRLGAYERGERICRAFAGGYPPETTPLPEGLPDIRQAIWINEWGLYLKNHGRLDAAARCCERYIEKSTKLENWINASIGNQNLVGVLLLTGRLTSGLKSTEEALRLADLADDNEERCTSYVYRAHAHAQRGQTDAALSDYQNALHYQHKAERENDRPLYSIKGLYNTLLLARLGKNKEAMWLTEKNNLICADETSQKKHLWFSGCILLLADLARERGELTNARNLLEQAYEWAIARDAKEELCWSALVRARIALHTSQLEAKNDREREQSITEALASVTEGLRIARDCGYGIYHIDLMLLRARLALNQGKPEFAIQDIHIALDNGVHPKPESGLPALLAANDPECGYAWGIAEGYHLRAEAYLLQAAQALGKPDFPPARIESFPDGVQFLIANARQQLSECIELRKNIQDCKIKETKKVLESLNGGVLTEYPIITKQITIEPPERPVSKRFRVALSFPGEHRDYISKVADCLAKELGKEKVLYDAYYEAEFARPDLDTHLQNLYRNQSDLIVIFLCKEYEKKKWCKLEWRAIRDLIAEKEESAIMPMRFDNTHIPGLFSIDGYVSINHRQPPEIASLIIQRLSINERSPI